MSKTRQRAQQKARDLQHCYEVGRRRGPFTDRVARIIIKYGKTAYNQYLLGRLHPFRKPPFTAYIKGGTYRG